MLGLGAGFYKLGGDAGSTYFTKGGGGTQSMAFDGVDQCVNINNLASTIAGTVNAEGIAFSASAWIKIGATSSSGNVFRMQYDSNNLVNMIYHHGTAELRCTIRAGGTSKQPKYEVAAGDTGITTSFRDDGVWHHVAMTASSDDDEVILYVDGTARQTLGSLGTYSANDINTAFIGQSTSDGGFWLGNLDEVAFWTIKLTSANITTLYNSSAASGSKTLDLASGTHVPVPVAWYRFEEPSGTVAINTADTSKNGTYINAPAISTSVP